MNFTEECFCFGTDDALVGVLTRPVTAEPASDAAVIFFNAGLVHRVGPSRLYVELARQLAALGWTCLRFDHAGIGDSPARGEQLPAEKAAVFEAIEAMDALARHAGCTRFVLAGMCAGTPTAFRAAVIDRRVEALVLLNSVLGDRASADEQALQEMTARKLAHSYWTDKVFRPRSWLRLLSGKTSPRRIFAMLLRAQRSNARRADTPLNGDDAAVLTDLGALCTRGSRVLLLFGEHTGVRHYFGMKFEAHLAQLPQAQRVTLAILAGGDHSFTTLALQDEVRARVSAWLGAAPDRSPQAATATPGAAAGGGYTVPRRRPRPS